MSSHVRVDNDAGDRARRGTLVSLIQRAIKSVDGGVALLEKWVRATRNLVPGEGRASQPVGVDIVKVDLTPCCDKAATCSQNQGCGQVGGSFQPADALHKVANVFDVSEA